MSLPNFSFDQQVNYTQTRRATAAVSDPLIRKVNLTIVNPDNLDNKFAETDITYDTPILNNGGENLVSVLNFSLPMQTLPLFVFPVLADQGSGVDSASINTSTLQVGVCQNMSNVWIEAGNVQPVTRFTQALTWVPQEMGTLKLPQDQTYQVKTEYYYCYSFEHFVNLTNKAVQTAYKAASSPGSAPSAITYAPKFAYDDTVKEFYWTLPSEFTGNTKAGATNGYAVCWNQDFDNLVNNFNVIENGNIFILEDQLGGLTNTNADGNIVMYQDYPTTDYFNSAERILVTTSSIPIAEDFFPGPYGQIQGLSSRERVLADVNLDFDNNITAQRSVLKYTPNTDLLEMQDINSTLPIQRISIKFKWIDSMNNAYDIPLTKTDVVTCRLGFFNKKLLLGRELTK